MGGSYLRNTTVTLPKDVGGTQYLFVVTGGPFEFIYTNNNSARSNPVNVTFVPPPPLDLEVTTVSGPATANDSTNVEVTWTIKNNGPTSLDS